ncbi:DoxX protein [Terrimicrobium sacchariphilum]|uniref:DoxX protein n=1 Tax=Terrimicrobium sacchariphilum TaxID=690879 RepID=A0A146GC35_TERSA|nr:MauE/DoxX family redox-associated membrane protein [Terrimicrobium sacchariphilum]GAT35145.1 DoxX protein [Terrimicrobium sacchariphilum]
MKYSANILLVILRIALGSVFLYAGGIKAMATESFALTLMPFTFIPPEAYDWIALLLPYTEILAALFIIFGLPRIGAAMILGLSVMFCYVIGWAISNQIIVSCGCFGTEDTAPSAAKMAWAMWRDVLLAAGSLVVLIFRGSWRAILRPLVALPASPSR